MTDGFSPAQLVQGFLRGAGAGSCARLRVCVPKGLELKSTSGTRIPKDQLPLAVVPDPFARSHVDRS